MPTVSRLMPCLPLIGKQGGLPSPVGLRSLGDKPPAWDNQKAGSAVRYTTSLNLLNRESKEWHQPSAAKLQPALNLKRQGDD
jgi:hypothetical protein